MASLSRAITPASCCWVVAELLVLPEVEPEPLADPDELPEAEPLVLPDAEPESLTEPDELPEALPLPDETEPLADPEGLTPASIAINWSWAS